MSARNIIGRQELSPCLGAMMITFVALLCFPCIASVKAESIQEKHGSKTKLRVLAYNVFVGFKNDDKRHEQVVAWIAAQKPDVVALQELNKYTEEKLREDARSWGHPYVKLCKVKSGFHLGLTSRQPIQNVHLITKKGLWHGLIHGQTHGIDFFVLHLAPKPEDIRLPETNIVLNEIRKIQSADRPTVLLGDFNSASRLDNDYYQHKSKYEPKYNVMDQYLNGGWVDLVHQQQGTITEKQASMPSLLIENKWGFWRIDYILASAQLAKNCMSARVMKEPATDYLSDHYPVMADFDWP
jgi:exodeoxyribonuclease III